VRRRGLPKWAPFHAARMPSALTSPDPPEPASIVRSLAATQARPTDLRVDWPVSSPFGRAKNGLTPGPFGLQTHLDR